MICMKSCLCSERIQDLRIPAGEVACYPSGERRTELPRILLHVCRHVTGATTVFSVRQPQVLQVNENIYETLGLIENLS